MILITGGLCQGKRAFAERLCRRELGETGRSDFNCASMADGREDSYTKAFEARIINHLELYIRRLMEAGEDSADFVERLIGQNGEAVVIADEIGCGIVPADAFERDYRETDGRLCQQIAAASKEVYRVVCGIEMKIK